MKFQKTDRGIVLLLLVSFGIIILFGVFFVKLKINDEDVPEDLKKHTFATEDQESHREISSANQRIVLLDDQNAYWDREFNFNQTVVLKWNITEAAITMMVIAKSKGSAYLGFTYAGVEVDVIVGNGSLIQDYHKEQENFILDNSQDYEFIAGKSNNSHIMFLFRRKVDTCDESDIKIKSDTMTILWGITNERIPSNKQLQNYKFWGRTKTDILSKEYPMPLGEDVHQFDVRIKNIRVEYPSSTEFYCRYERIPNFRKKQHIIGYELLTSEANRAFIHHLVLSVCSFDFPKEEETFMCYDPYHLSLKSYCLKVINVLGPGPKKYFLPPHIGTPFGSSENQTLYFHLDLHYNIEKKISVLNDNSGIRLYHTDKLREFDSGFIKVGSEVFEIIPPGQKEFSNFGICPSDCLKMHIPPTGFYIVSYILHSHHRAKKVRLRQIRDGVEIARFSDDYFDFNYHMLRKAVKEIHILPTDTLAMECIYDSTNDTSLVAFGLNSENEMCEAYIITYPSVGMYKCMSNLQTNSLTEVFPEIPYTENVSLLMYLIKQYTFNEYLSKITDLLPGQLQKLKNLVFHGTYEMYCPNTDGVKKYMNFTLGNIIPFKEPNSCLH